MGTTKLTEIVEDAEVAQERWGKTGRKRPKEPKITVPADLFAELLAHAGRENWIIYSPTWSEALQELQSVETATEQS